MSLFDTIRYPILPGQTFIQVAVDLPQDMRLAFYTHPEYEKSSVEDDTFEQAYNKVERNTALLRRIILQWDSAE